MAAPTYVQTVQTIWTSTATPKALPSINGALGDVLVVAVGDFDHSSGSTENPAFSSSPAETFTEQTQTAGIASADAWAQTATAILSAARTGLVVSVSNTAQSAPWGAALIQFTDATGVGASARSTGAGTAQPALAITTTQDNSAIVYFCANWTDDANAARTHRVPSGGSAPVEIGHYNDVSNGAMLWAYCPDAGPAGAKTVGLTAPSGDYQIVAVEILGVSGPPPAGFLKTESGLRLAGLVI